MKKFVSIVLVLIMMLALAGCGNNAADNSDHPDFVYKATKTGEVISTKDEPLAAEPACFVDGGYLAIGGKYLGEIIPKGAKAEYEGQFDHYEKLVSFVDYSGNVKVLENYSPVEFSNGNETKRDYIVDGNIEKILEDKDGNYILIESVYASWFEGSSDVEYGTEKYYEGLKNESASYITKIDKEGNILSREKCDLPENASWYYSIIDSSGNVLFSVEGDTYAVMALSTTGEIAYELPVDNSYIYYMSTLKDGRTAVSAYDLTKYEMSLKTIDPDTHEFEAKTYAFTSSAYNLYGGNGDYDLYYTTGSSLFGYVLETGESTKLFSFMDMDLISNYVNLIFIGEDNVINIVSYNSSNSDENTYAHEIFKVEKAPYEASGEKTHLKMASFNADTKIMDEVINFNRNHDDVRIDIEDYADYNTEEDYSAGMTKLLTEIGAGNIPDLLDISSEMPYQQFAGKGILEDLYPYLDKDSDIKREDIFPNILKAFEIDGKLYEACSGFGVYTAAASASVVGDEPGLTYDEYFEALAKMPEGCDGFDVGYTQEDVLYVCLALDMTDYVNWSTGEVNFENEDFYNLLKFAKSFPAEFDYENYEYSLEDSADVRIAEGRQMMTSLTFSSVQYFLKDYDAMFGGNATLCGFPTNNGVGSMLMVGDGIAMTTNCKDKDAAWDLVKVMFSEEFQEDMYYLPTNQKVFEKQLADAMEVKYETDANGNYILDENGEKVRQSIGSYYDGIQEVTVYSLNADQAEMLKEGIAQANKLMSYDKDIIDIVTENAKAYFEGQKTVEEVANLISSKAGIYVNEQK